MFAVAVALAAFADPRPAAWAADLRSPVFAARAAAAEALERAGVVALPALAAAAAGPDPEAAHRAADLIARITRRLTAGRLLAPTVVTLPPGPLTADALFDAVSGQTGYVLDHPPAAATLTPPAGPLTVWAAVQLGCDAAGLEVTTVAPRGPRPPPETESDEALNQVLVNLEATVEQTLVRRAAEVDAARLAIGRAEDPAEKAKREADHHRLADDFNALVRYCGERAARREVARLAAASDPEPAGRIVLRPAVGRAVTAVAGTVRVDGRAAPDRLAAGVPAGQAAVLVRVRAEPQRAVERVDGVWVRRATAGRHELPRGPDGVAGLVRSLPVSRGSVRLAGDGTATYSRTEIDRATGVCGPNEAVVRVVAPAGTDRLAELFGVVRVVVRDDPGELAACPLPGSGSADGVRLVADPPAVADDGRLAVDITVVYDPAAVRPGGGAGLRFDPDRGALAFARGGFIQWNARQSAAAAARAGPTADGLTLVDAGGRVLAAVAVRASRADGTAGTVADRLHVRVTPKPGQGPPVRVLFAGARAVTVEVPFALADVSAAPGTAEAVR